MSKEQQDLWDDHFERLRKRREDEARAIIALSRTDGVTDDTLVVLSYSCISSNRKNADLLAAKMSETDDIRVDEDLKNGCWRISGASDAEGLPVPASTLLEWIEFVCDISKCLGCSFAAWELYDPTTKRKWKSRELDLGASRFVPDSSHQDIISHHVSLASRTLNALRTHGVSDDTSLVLDYFFYTDTGAKAERLLHGLRELGYTSESGVSESDVQQVVVTGQTRRLEMNNSSIVSWIRQMCELGFKHDAKFDGWGVTPTVD